MRSVAAAALVLTTAAAQPSGEVRLTSGAPKVLITYEGLFDQRCGGGPLPRPEVRDELRRRLPEFRAAWAAAGPRLMQLTQQLARQPYRFAEAEAVLHGCDDFGSVSSPLLIAAARYTDAWAAVPNADGTPRSGRAMNDFVNSLWHEVHHRYVREFLATRPGGTTPLREKYANETVPTRNHLHLFALERLVWDRAGLSKEQDDREARIISRGDPSLRRAYEIVRVEGAQTVVRELWR